MSAVLFAASRKQAIMRAPIAPAIPTTIEIGTTFLSCVVVQASTVTRTITLTRNGGYSGTVSLAVTGLPTGVTGAFSPPSLTGGTLTSVLTLSAAADAPIVTSDAFTVTASGSGVTDATLNMTVTVTDLSNFDDVAELPGARLTALDDWASPIPDWGAIPGGRRVTVAANTEAALQSAINTAAALTGGHRLVLIPDGFDARCNLQFAINADPAYDIILAWESVVDGTYPLTRGTIIPETAPAGMPLLETKSAGASVELAVLSAVQNGAICNYKVYGCEIRVAEEVTGNRYCSALIDWGYYAVAMDFNVANLPHQLLLSHCIIGGRKFDSAGNWRTGNLGRAIYDRGSSVALLDCWDVEHGAPGGNGSDRGILNGIFAIGPHLVRGCATDFGGGIVFMNGGADCPVEGWPSADDCLYENNWIERRQEYNPNNLAMRELDASSAPCPWTQKNQWELKNGKRVAVRRNVFIGHWQNAQINTIVLKSNNQSGGELRASSDVTVAENIIVTGCGGIVWSPIQGTAPIKALQRTTIRGNIIVFGAQSVYPNASAGNWRGISMSYGDGLSTIPYAGDLSIINNHCEVSGAPTSTGLIITGGVKDTRRALFRTARNVFIGPFTDATNDVDGGRGLNNMLSAWNVAATQDVRDNVFTNATGTAPANDSTHAANQIYRTGKTAIGLTNGAALGMFTRSGGSELIASAVSGGDIGPDYADLSALYSELEARAYP